MAPKSQPTKWTRRRWIQSGLAAATAPMVLSGRVLGGRSLNDTIQIGFIGTGRMGTANLRRCLEEGRIRNARVVAVCDVDSRRVESARRLVEETYAGESGGQGSPGCAVYSDYRELLARNDIDGMVISTPEHWHALNAIDAAAAGKDAYVEKPLTYSVSEGRALVKAVRRHGRVLQTGSQQRSSSNFRRACELVRSGRIGKLHTIVSQMPVDEGHANPDPMPVPENLDYDFWMGPTAEKPYTEDRVHPQDGFGRPGWLQIERYCRGMITGWGSHMNDIVQWGNGSDDSGLVEIRARAEFPKRGLFDVHTTFEAEGLYPNGVRLIQRSGDAGVRFVGEEGWIWVERGGIEVEPASLLEEPEDRLEVRLYESNNHMGNFLECMRSRRDPVAPVEIGHRSNSLCVITHIAMHLDRTLRWDPETERFLDDEEADRLLGFSYRAPWQHPV